MTLPLPPELPVLPTPRERALLVLMNPDAALEDFTAVIEGDPAMTASVLRAANSAISFPVRPIAGAAEAVVRLGTRDVKHLVTATLLRSQFDSLEPAGIDTDELWRHLLGCALLCEAQAGAGEEQRQAAFTAGMLHDLGRLAMGAQAPSRYRAVVDAVQDGLAACEAERRTFGLDHAEFGRQIAERWRMAPEIVAAIVDHHGPSSDDAPAVVGYLEVARGIVAGLGIGDGVGRPERRSAEAEEHPLIASLGGRTEFMSSIRWFRDSTSARRRTAA